MTRTIMGVGGKWDFYPKTNNCKCHNKLFFSLAQVNAIKETSLARILCDNGDNIQLMQPLAFKAPTTKM